MFQTVPMSQAIIMQDGKEKSSCSRCGMKLPMFYKTNHVATTASGKINQYCSIHCLTEHKHKETTQNERVVNVTTLEFIEAKKAFYVVGSKKKGTMSRVSKYAFANKTDAQMFIKKYGGKITSYDEAIKIAEKDFRK